MSSPLIQGQQIPNHLVTSLPNLLHNNNNNTNLPTPQIGTILDDNNNIKPHHPLSLLQELMPMPNNNQSPNNTTCATLFSRTLSPPSPLQLNVFEESGRHLQPPLMSATALLQKAAQMGATISNNNNNDLVTSMAPASFGVGHNNNNSGFVNSHRHFMQMNNHEDDHHQYLNGNCNGSAGMNGVDMFNAILDQSKAFSKIIENNNNKGSGDVMTLDFLGINGSGGASAAGGHIGNFYATLPNHQAAAEKATRDHEIWRNWSNNNNNEGFESFSATSSIN